MAITKKKKQEILALTKERLEGTKSVVFVSFKMLSVLETKILRRKLAASQLGYFVAKKSLLKKVLGELKITGDMPELPGELAIAYVPTTVVNGDLLSPSRETYAFQKVPHGKGSISIVGGIFDGVYKTQNEMMAIATIPSPDVLRGMFVNIINSPIQRFVIALGEISNVKSISSV